MKNRVKKIALLNILAGIVLFESCKNSQIEEPFDCNSSNLSVVISASTEASCGDENGALSLTITGGTSPYTIEVNGSETSTNTLTGLSAGIYEIQVTDANNCQAMTTGTVNNTDGVIIQSVSTQPSDCGVSIGSITIVAAEGLPPYQYKLGNGAFQSSNQFSGLAPGNYSVTVTDANDCDISSSASILSGISLTDDIFPIITAKCATASCHGGNQNPNLSTKEQIIAQAARVQARTSAGTMPPTGPLPSSDVAKITCWVNDKAPNN